MRKIPSDKTRNTNRESETVKSMHAKATLEQQKVKL